MTSVSSILPGNVIYLKNSDFPKFLQQNIKSKIKYQPYNLCHSIVI